MDSPEERPPAMPERRRSARRFVGRERELARLSTSFEAGAPLTTLTGALGVGKTTLLQQWLAHADLARAGWRVWSVDGARCGDFDTLARALLGLAGVDANGDVEAQLVDTLSGAPTVIVADGIDSIVRSCAGAFERWLARAPELQILVGSRERLATPGEHVIELAPLDLASSQALLLSCAGDLGPELREEIERDAALPRLVAALGGLPLAIELAAARCRLLSPQEIVRRQDRGEVVLGATMETAIASSVKALAPDEAALLRALSVFEGEVDLDTVTRVCAGAGEGDALERAQALRDASLVQIRHGGCARWLSLLPPIRAHLRRALDASPERDTVVARHRAWALERGEALVRALADATWPQALEALRAHRADLGAALDGAIRGRASEAFRLLIVVDVFMQITASRSGLIDAFDTVLAWEGIGTEEERAETALRRAEIAYKRGDQALARTLLDASERALGARAHWISVDGQLRLLQRAEVEVPLARLERAAEDACRAGDARGEALLRETMVELHRERRDSPAALREGARALAVLGSGHPGVRASVLTGMAFAAAEGGNHTLAGLYAGEGLEVLDGCKPQPSRTRSGLALAKGRAAHVAGDLDAAVACYREARTGPDRTMALYAGAALGSTLVDAGRVLEARDEWRAIVEELGTHDAMQGVMCAAALGALESRLGERERGRERLDRARAKLGANAPWFASLVLDTCDAVARGAPLGPAGDPQSAPASVELGVLQRIASLPSDVASSAPLRVRELRVASSGRWFRVAGRRVPCAQRPVMRRLVVALASARVDSPGRSLVRDELLQHGWGGELMQEASARRRLEVMISRIRALGIDDALETTEAGYRIHEECRVLFEDEEESATA